MDLYVKKVIETLDGQYGPIQHLLRPRKKIHVASNPYRITFMPQSTKWWHLVWDSLRVSHHGKV
jgi:hypothetical protein